MPHLQSLQPLQPIRPLGNTGVTVPLVGYGTAPLGKEQISRARAVRCLNHAIDAGITYIDTSPDYGSEPHVGAVMQRRRDEVFLATKVNKRSRSGVLEELQQSLQRLQTDHVDLIQIHAVNTWADLEQALAPDGAVAGLEEAREQGMARHIGITGHARPELLAQALDRYPFDTVLVALGMADRLVSSPETTVLPIAARKGVGVIAMKTLGHGCFRSRDLALRYALGQQEVSLAIVGMDSPTQIDEIVDIASDFRPLLEDEEDRLVEEVRPLILQDSDESKKGESRLFWLHDTSVTGWREKNGPALVDY
jgi:aryl-alcohol dehydrogenase-like predicted oxidoreductase